jgi:filamentous hemagglutinin family protein
MLRSLVWLGILGTGFMLASSVQAQQVMSDGTVNTIVTRSGNTFTITNGSAAGTNLFHSFQEFSIPTGGTATFDLVNTPAISAIFSRVTGGTVSSIDGAIRTINSSHPVSLFLLNPNGILFGKDARLDIGGSFVGTTAQAIKFSDGTEFSPVTSAPLLTISVPIGIQMGTNPAAIQVNGSNLANSTELRVQPGQTLALLGGHVILNGGNLQAPGGQVVLAGVLQPSTISLAETLTIPKDVKRGNVTLKEGAIVNVTSANGGQISIHAANLEISTRSRLQAGFSFSAIHPSATSAITIDTTNKTTLREQSSIKTTNGGNISIDATNFQIAGGSTTIADTVNANRAGNINIRAAEQVEIVGSTGTQVSRLESQVEETATGNGGNITIQTRNLRIAEGGRISAETTGAGHAGNINIQAAQLVEVTGSSPLGVASRIDAEVEDGATGNGGNITIATTDFRVVNGSRISVETEDGLGNAGNIEIRARGTIEIVGVESADLPNTGGRTESTVKAGVDGRSTQGKGGDIFLEASTLRVAAGGSILANTQGIGQGGAIRINAKTVEVLGAAEDGSFFSTITALAELPDTVGNAGNLEIRADRLRLTEGAQITTGTFGKGNGGNLTLYVNDLEIIGSDRFGLGRASSLRSAVETTTATGNGGNLSVYSDRVRLSEGAEISASGFGLGNAGTVQVRANEIALDTASSITAVTTSGEGGSIALQTQLLQLRRNSMISTNAGGTGNGGNITIQAPIILGWENSDIVANAVKGQGGNINITTQGILGLKYRDRLTPENDITASSEFGINGSVQVNNIGVDPNAGLVELAGDLVDDKQQIAKGCSSTQGSSFVITGRGGTPINPLERVNRDRTWADLRAFSPTSTTTATLPVSEPLIEAASWQRNPKTGKVELLTAQSMKSTQSVTCSN